MKRILKLSLLAGITIVTFISACQCPGKTSQSQAQQVPGPKVVIYQTKADYSQNVPVTLSDDRKTIESYPHPRDLVIDGKFVTPTPLNKDFLLDNRGINKNVAFLNYTYDEYSKLANPPSVEELMIQILDKKPLKKMYICKTCIKGQITVEKINSLIDNGDFSEFNKVR